MKVTTKTTTTTTTEVDDNDLLNFFERLDGILSEPQRPPSAAEYRESISKGSICAKCGGSGAEPNMAGVACTDCDGTGA
jgi:hypothetical protein